MRHDEKYLRLIHKHISYPKFEKLSKLPFFYFTCPDMWLDSPGYVNMVAVKQYVTDHARPMAHMIPFPEFTCIVDGDASLHHITHGYHPDTGKEGLAMDDYFRPKDYPQNEQYAIRQTPEIEKGVWRHRHLLVDEQEYRCEANHFNNRKKIGSYEILSYGEPLLTQIYERNQIDYVQLTMTILALFLLADERSERLVRVTAAPVKKRKSRGQPSKSSANKYAAKHHYVYLDGPPPHVMSNEELGVAKGTKRGHARKAHWRKLTHERFKNHPKFGQTVRVKATWVGPIEWADQGKIYTLHDVEDL
jgi:hypothetical protein